jgi:O-antigen/teichoic acid export membrane protein
MHKNLSLLKRFKSEYVINFLSVASGTLAAQVITFISSIFLARAFTAEAFGYFSTFSATVSIFSIISCLRYELAIPLPKELSEIRKIFKLVILIILNLGVISLFILLILKFLGKFDLGLVMVFVFPISFYLSGQNIALNILHNKLNQFRHSSIGKIINSLFTFIFSLFFSLGFKNEGLIFGFVFGQILLSIYLFSYLPSDFKKKVFTNFNFVDSRNILIKYISFPKYSLLPALLNIITSQAPNFIIAYIFGWASAGLYFFSFRLVSLPVSLIGTSINDVIYQRIIEKKNSNQLVGNFFLKNFYFLLTISLIFLFLVLILAGVFIPLFFGTKWTNAILVCKILAASSFIKLIVSPLTIVLIGLNKIFVSARWQYLYFGGLIIVLIVLYILKVSFINFLIALSVYDVTLYLYAFFLIKHEINVYDNTIQ